MNNAEWSPDEEKEIIDGLSKDGYHLVKEVIRKSDPNFRKAITTFDFVSGFSNEIDNLNKTQIPVTLIFSTDDKYVDISYCKGLSKSIENSQAKTIFVDHGRHLPFFNFPAVFCSIVET